MPDLGWGLINRIAYGLSSSKSHIGMLYHYKSQDRQKCIAAICEPIVSCQLNSKFHILWPKTDVRKTRFYPPFRTYKKGEKNE